MTPADAAPARDLGLERSVAAVRDAVREALIEHKRRGEAVVVRENGRIKWIAAEDIVIPDEVGAD
jgi:hypothetical protein